MSRNLTDALSKLFIKLGGKTSDSKENKGPIDYIDDITDIVEPGGGSSQEDFIIEYEIDDLGNITNQSKTILELVNAIIDKKRVLANFILPLGNTIYGVPLSEQYIDVFDDELGHCIDFSYKFVSLDITDLGENLSLRIIKDNGCLINSEIDVDNLSYSTISVSKGGR